MEFKIWDTNVQGFLFSIKASGNPMRTEIDESEPNVNDWKRAFALGSVPTGTGHDNFLKGIIVQANFCAPLYWWKQAQRYHWFDFISSQSTMHSLMKFDIDKQCTKDVDPRIIQVLQEKIAEYKEVADSLNAEQKEYLWRGIIASLPSGFCLSASMTTNYQQLKTMYLQRRGHKLQEWKDFCKWCEELPSFMLLVTKEKINGETN